jgi:hypothetical protein
VSLVVDLAGVIGMVLAVCSCLSVSSWVSFGVGVSGQRSCRSSLLPLVLLVPLPLPLGFFLARAPYRVSGPLFALLWSPCVVLVNFCVVSGSLLLLLLPFRVAAPSCCFAALWRGD